LSFGATIEIARETHPTLSCRAAAYDALTRIGYAGTFLAGNARRAVYSRDGVEFCSFEARAIRRGTDEFSQQNAPARTCARVIPKAIRARCNLRAGIIRCGIGRIARIRMRGIRMRID